MVDPGIHKIRQVQITYRISTVFGQDLFCISVGDTQRFLTAKKLWYITDMFNGCAYRL
jgi:hypothetical protein